MTVSVLVYPPYTPSRTSLTPLVEWQGTVLPLSIQASWSRVGCDQLTVRVLELPLSDALVPRWRLFPAPYAGHVELLVNGRVVWEGLVWKPLMEGQHFAGFEARGYSNERRLIVTISASQTSPYSLNAALDQVVQHAAPWLVIERHVVVDDKLTQSLRATVQDLLQRIRSLVGPNGFPVDAMVIPPRRIVISERMPQRPRWVAPETLEFDWPDLDEIATHIATPAADVRDDVRALQLGTEIQLVVPGVNSSGTAMKLLQSDYIPLPNARWTGRGTWTMIDGRDGAVSEIEIGDAVLIPNVATLSVERIAWSWPADEYQIDIGRPKLDNRVGERAKQVLRAVLLGRNPNTWL